MKAATLKTKRVKLADLKPHPKNPREHPEPGSDEWNALKKSLSLDYFDPLIVNSGKKTKSLKNVIVSGHLRTLVLMSEGYTHADAVVTSWNVLLQADRRVEVTDRHLLFSRRT